MRLIKAKGLSPLLTNLLFVLTLQELKHRLAMGAMPEHELFNYSTQNLSAFE